MIHALDCHKVGLVTQCHDRVRDILDDLAALGYREVVKLFMNLIIRMYDDEDSSALISDLKLGCHKVRPYVIWEQQILMQLCMLVTLCLLFWLLLRRRSGNIYYLLLICAMSHLTLSCIS